MKERIIEFLKAENKSSAQFAEEIGVQPSGISHILSGRNNPSLDFIIKMLEKYGFISTEWLLFGKGTMYKDTRMQTLFEDMEINGKKIDNHNEETHVETSDLKTLQDDLQKPGSSTRIEMTQNSSDLNKIVLFYSDGKFEEYIKR